MHWVLAVINCKRKERFKHNDSLAGPDPGFLPVRDVTFFLLATTQVSYCKDERRAKNNEDLDLAEWSDYQLVRFSPSFSSRLPFIHFFEPVCELRDPFLWGKALKAGSETVKQLRLRCVCLPVHAQSESRFN